VLGILQQQRSTESWDFSSWVNVGYTAKSILEHLHGVGLGRLFCDMYLVESAEQGNVTGKWNYLFDGLYL
jgi:hypothetical protein